MIQKYRMQHPEDNMNIYCVSFISKSNQQRMNKKSFSPFPPLLLLGDDLNTYLAPEGTIRLLDQ